MSGGLLSRHFAGYEIRDGQVSMAKIVERAIGKNSCAVIEGATGVGKSIAYLVPIILSGKKAIISTSNKSLQDQLANKDLPMLKKILKTDISWEVLKGRNNYFCMESYEAHKGEILDRMVYMGISSKNARLRLSDTLRWAKKTTDGDIESLPVSFPSGITEMMTCNDTIDHKKGSPFRCFASEARARAKKARILLINHSLLALDIAIRIKTDGSASFLPDNQVVVVDEAHNLERYAIMAFSEEISIFSLTHLTNKKVVRDSVKASKINKLVAGFVSILKGYMPSISKDGYYKQEEFGCFVGFGETILGLMEVSRAIEGNKKIKKDDLSKIRAGEVVKECHSLIRRLKALEEKNDNILRWSEARKTSAGTTVLLKSVPIEVAGILKENLFNNRTVICTSATLAAGGNFDFLSYQIGVPDSAIKLITSSPFDFKKQSLIYITSGRQERDWEIQELLKHSRGRAFILFTSYKDMNSCYEKIDIPYPKLIQSVGVSRRQLLDEFRTTPNAILFATRSFWEGIDIQGEQLSMVVIYKVPFENPSDLIYLSKIRKMDEELGKGAHWMGYTVPDACLKLKQGIGRLIRTRNDMGVIALMDARVNYQNYGKTILGSLPPTYKTQNLDDVRKFFERQGNDQTG